MSECKWDPSKHGGKACPVHGSGAAGTPGTGGHKIRINNGKYQAKLDDNSDWEDLTPEEYGDLRETGKQEFDETNDDDFGFDEEDPTELSELFTDDDLKTIDRYSSRYDVDEDDLTGEIYSKAMDKIIDGVSPEDAKSEAMEEVFDELASDRSTDDKSAIFNDLQRSIDEAKSTEELSDIEGKLRDSLDQGLLDKPQYDALSEQLYNNWDVIEDLNEEESENNQKQEGGADKSVTENDGNKKLNVGDRFSFNFREFEVTNVDDDHIYAKDARTGTDFGWTKDELLNDESFKIGSDFEEWKKQHNNRSKEGFGSEESNVKYLAPEEIGIDYDNPEGSIRYYEKKNNVKLYEQPNGSFKVVPNKGNQSDKKDNQPYQPDDTAKNVARVFLEQKFGYDEDFLNSLTDEDLELAAKFFKKFNIDKIGKR